MRTNFTGPLLCILLLLTGLSMADQELDLNDYCTGIRLLEDTKISLYTPSMFRVRVSRLQGDGIGDAFPSRYEIPFVIGRLKNWAPVGYKKWEEEAVIFIRTEILLIKFHKTTRQWEVWTADGKKKIHPSTSPVFGMFKNGYTLFDNASAFNEYNNNSRYSHWFYNPKTKSYVDTYLEEDLISDLYFIYGPGYEKLFYRFNQLVGPEPLLPKKAYGFFQTQHLACQGTQEKLLETARLLRERGIPCDTLIIDFEWGDGCDGNREVKWGSRLEWSSNYTTPFSPEEMIKRLHQMHFNVMLIHHNAPDFPNRHHQGWTETIVNDTSWWKKFTEKLDIGVDGTWQDTRRNDITDSVIWNGLDSYFGGKRRVLFMGCRKMQLTNPWDKYFCALPMNQMIGSRRYPFDWTGDCSYSWAELAWQIKAITNTHGAMKGVSYISSDAVGANWKIQARWNQFADFTPISRSHNPKPWSGNIRVKDFVDKIRITDRKAIKSKDESNTQALHKKTETAEDSIRKHRKLRYRLLPYIYTYAHINYRTGMPVCRPMLLAFPGDHMVNGDQWPYQYMFGEWLLVAPVYGDFNTMEIYLPAGHRWIDYWSKEIYEGGGILRYDVSDVNRLPLFVKAGAILPMRQDSLWIDPALQDQLTFEIYPEKNSLFTLYEDDNVTTTYQRGKYSTMPVRCSKSGKTIHISIGAAAGQFQGIPAKRDYRLKVFLTSPAAGAVSVRIDDKDVLQGNRANKRRAAAWFFNRWKNCLVIDTGNIKTNSKHSITITFTGKPKQ